ncbi:MAG: glycosyltransferase family 4 protein [Rhodothermales bacterium]
MRILVHDYGGYAFPFQLSLELARRGHFVSHAFCADLVTTPPGVPEEGDEPINLSVDALSLGAPLQKYDFVTRWKQERAYGRLIADHAEAFGPDIVLSANTPLDAQRRLQAWCRGLRIPFVFWLQDMLGLAAHRILSARIPIAGNLIGRYYMRMERRLLAASTTVVAITPAFLPPLQDWGIEDARIQVIENWAPLDRLSVRPKANAWSRRHGLDQTFNFLYAGTLGMKHNPERLLALARETRDDEAVRVVVASQAQGADWLRERAVAEGLRHLIVLPYQAVDDLPDLLAAGDVLVALLEADAGLYSVPSKVMAYLCAERPLLLAVPAHNDAARIVQQTESGLVVDPADAGGFIAAAQQLRAATEQRRAMGINARRYAEETFDPGRIADRFESLLADAANPPA